VKAVSSSFRDPSGYVYKENDIYLRRVSPSYQEIMMETAPLLSHLIQTGKLLPFKWISEDDIEPEQVPFISYPYEWSFNMLRDAALLTLDTQLTALDYQMQLKDASAYNVQFVRGKPVLIDHLSFHPHVDGEPWVAYRQFCEHFLAPLLLASYRNYDLVKLLQLDVRGLKLGVVSNLLPFRARMRPGVLMHIVLHGLDRTSNRKVKISRKQVANVVSSLRSLVSSLNWTPNAGWKYYEQECNYSAAETHNKAHLVESMLREVAAKSVLDLGCNVGLYSQVATDIGCHTIAIDSDPACVDLLYCSNGKFDRILPLVIDIANPSPSIGWECSERDSFFKRLNVDTIMCLALVHHLAIGNNVPLDRIASFLATNCKNLVIEWVPKEDSKVQFMLRSRRDIFDNYTEEGFLKSFGNYFNILRKEPVSVSSCRSLYLMRRR